VRAHIWIRYDGVNDSDFNLLGGAQIWEVGMIELIQALSRVTATTNIKTQTLVMVLAACGCASIIFWLLRATYGLDLSPGFF
jgi:hypothetical protein